MYKDLETFSTNTIPELTKWIGAELTYPAYARVYNSRMTIDDNTIIEPGIQSGIGNYMRIGEITGDHTLLQFLDCFSFTGEHVDRAKVVSEVKLDNRDLRQLAALLNDRANTLSSPQ